MSQRAGIREQADPRLAQSMEGGDGLDVYSPWADRQDQPAPLLDLTYDYHPNLMLFPWNLGLDYRMRQLSVVDPARTYPLAQQNRQLLYELGDDVGHEGSDFQNPYAWAARGVLVYPNAASTGLAADSFGEHAGDNATDVALNVRATAGVLQVGALS